MDWISVVAITSTAASVVAIPLAIILYKKSVRKKDPAWAYCTEKIIGLGGNAPAELKLVFNGKSVEDVYRTSLILFNRGREVIDSGDVVDPLVIQFTGAEVLRPPNVVARSRDEVRFNVDLADNQKNSLLTLSFAYLDHEDGALIEVIHTESESISCKANIRGAKQIPCMPKFDPHRLPVSVTRRLAVTAVPFALVMVWWLYIGRPMSAPFITTAIYLSLGFITGVLMSRPQGARLIDKFPRWSILRK